VLIHARSGFVHANPYLAKPGELPLKACVGTCASPVVLFICTLLSTIASSINTGSTPSTSYCAAASWRWPRWEQMKSSFFTATQTPISSGLSAHLVATLEQIEVGTPVLIVGFPLGFHDTLHHLPVARQAVIASAFGMRFQGQGYFLTDARMHRGASGAPVVARMTTEQSGREALPWTLLGVHAARMDVTRDIEQDERLDLNCAWYTDIIMRLTDPPATG
jgi:hypothetical protein